MAYNFPPKQDLLVSGTNLKTINSNSLLGSGNLTIAGLPSVGASDTDKVISVDSVGTASWQYAGLGSGNFLTDNVILGRSKPSGLSNVANIVIGTSPTGDALSNSAGNTLIGSACGRDITGHNNTCIGIRAGTESYTSGIYSGSENVCIGNQAGLDSTHNATNATVVGTASGADSYAVMIGSGGRARSYGIAIGSSARAWNSCINIGYYNCWNDYGGKSHFIVGNYARNPNVLTNICAFGGPDLERYNTAYWGQGICDITGANLFDFKSTVTPASGTDATAAKGTFTIAGAQGTGSGVGGAVIIATAPAGVAGGSTANAHFERLRVTAGGDVRVPTYIISPQVFNTGAYSSGTVTIDWAQSPVQTIIVQGNITLNFVNQAKGGSYALRIRQDGTGGTITWPSTVSWPGNAAPTLSSPGNMDIINFLYFSDLDKYLATSALNFPFTVLPPDSDAEDFITNAGISDETHRDAIRVLVANLKGGTNLWSKLAVIYPFVGGTATTHKYNLKDPRDLDAAFRMVFDTTSTPTVHDFQGVTARGRTQFNARTYAKNNIHTSFYSPDASSLVSMVYGTTFNKWELAWTDSLSGSAVGSLDGYALILGINHSDDYYVQDMGAPAPTGTAKSGYFIANSSLTATTIHRNGVELITGPARSPSYVGSSPIYILKDFVNSSTPTRKCSFMTIGEALTPDQIWELHNAVQTFQIALGRAV